MSDAPKPTPPRKPATPKKEKERPTEPRALYQRPFLTPELKELRKRLKG